VRLAHLLCARYGLKNSRKRKSYFTIKLQNLAYYTRGKWLRGDIILNCINTRSRFTQRGCLCILNQSWPPVIAVLGVYPCFRNATRAKQGCYRDWQGHTPFVSINKDRHARYEMVCFSRVLFQAGYGLGERRLVPQEVKQSLGQSQSKRYTYRSLYEFYEWGANQLCHVGMNSRKRPRNLLTNTRTEVNVWTHIIIKILMP
jgi:hypothetical protein